MHNNNASIPANGLHAKKPRKSERPISDAYREIDNDLARDNIENDLPNGDLEDL